MNCTSCGGALALQSPTCSYCGTVNAVDLIAVGKYRRVMPSAAHCPNQCGKLQGIEMGEQFAVTALHCETCKGLHITRPMLNSLLLSVAKQVREINIERIVKVATEQVVQQKKKIRFCPVCQKIDGMQFNKFLAQMPVMIDECAEHGIWFDNGELHLLLEWAESGGMQVLKRQREAVVPDEEPPPPAPKPALPLPLPYKRPPWQDFWMYVFLGSGAAGYYFIGVLFVGLANANGLWSVGGLLLWPLCWWLSAYAGAKANQTEGMSFKAAMLNSLAIILIIGCGMLAVILPFIFIPVIVFIIWFMRGLNSER